MSEDEGRLARWSRRKRKAGEAEREEAARSAEASAEAAPAGEGEPSAEDLAGLPDAEVLERLGLKDPDQLQPGDDFTAFLKQVVPEHLRRRALRRLWRSNPVLANLDGLNDYDTDFTGGSVAPGMLKTAYKVGVGLLRDLPDEEEQAGGAVGEAEAQAAAAAEDSAADATEVRAEAEENDSERQISQDGDRGAVRARRRMRFDFG
ncbi:MAG: DUF3306 domain-containing protein [Paracoccaceae bacterium]|nr:DUF3306 domain-containing protein [Paracoccaceae bacterium]